MHCASMCTQPSSGRTNPAIARSAVVLPHPDAPSRQPISPDRRRKVSRSSAATRVRAAPKETQRSSTCSAHGRPSGACSAVSGTQSGTALGNRALIENAYNSQLRILATVTPNSTFPRSVAPSGTLSTQLLAGGSVLGSLVVALPIIAVVWLALSPTDAGTDGDVLAHLFGTVLPRYTI